MSASWSCDECGEPIDRPEDGWVEWLVYGEYPMKGLGLRLVHHYPASPIQHEGGCYYIRDFERGRRREAGFVLDNHMAVFMGPAGLVRLLEILERGHCAPAELALIVKRLHVPGYEEANPPKDFVSRRDMLMRVEQEERATRASVGDLKQGRAAINREVEKSTARTAAQLASEEEQP